VADLLSIGGSAASVAVNPESPFAWASLAKDIGGLLGAFGGGKTSSVFQGTRITGTLDARGFRGTATAYDQLGNQWVSTGEQNWLNSLSLATLATGDLNPSQATIDDFNRRAAGRSLQLDFVDDKNTSAQPILATVAARFLGLDTSGQTPAPATTTADSTAPAIDAGAQPFGTPSGGSVGSSMAGSGGSTVAPAPGAMTPEATNTLSPAGMLLFAIGAYYLFKKA
jgi:hypothetical protein